MSRAKSGMETDKRDLSSSSVSNPGPKSSQEIYWPPIPPPTKLSGAAQRLKDIQDALANCSTPVTNRKGQNKRPGSTGPADGLAGKRLRQLPPSWENDSLSTLTFGSGSSPSRPTPPPPGAAQHLKDIQKLGMGTDKRDFSSSSIFNPPKSSQEIYLPPTPPPTKLSNAAQRLKEIQDALAKCSTLVTDSKGQNKRPGSTGPADGPAGKRLRQLPPSWENDSLSTPTFGSGSSPSRPTPPPPGAAQHLRDIQKLEMGADKRDFSSSSISNPPKSSQEIYLPPTPPPTKLSSAAQRLKEIEAALAKCSTPVTDSKGQNKRPSPTGPADGPAAKRLRQLPPGWPKAPTFGSDSSPSRPSSLSTSSTTGRSSTSSLASTQLVFLSQDSDRPRE